MNIGLEKCPSKIKHQKLLTKSKDIIDFYTKENLTLREIAKLFNTEKGAIKRILVKNNITIIKASHRKKELICINCHEQFQGRKGCSKRCENCRLEESRREARTRQRIKLGIDINKEVKCLKCEILIPSQRANREYCDKCRRIRLNELKRERRAKDPEKYRQKDKEYLKKTKCDIVITANRRFKGHGKSPISLKLMNEIFKEDHYKCQYCYQTGKELTLDHIIPLKENGENTKNNLVTSCRSCNISKGKKSLLQFLLYVSKRRMVQNY